MNPPAVTVASGARSRVMINGAVLAFVLLFAVSLVPVLWFDLPAAMVDYPNHLARMFLLSRDGSANANPYYEVIWSFVPNLAMDLIVPGAGRFIGIEMADRLFYLLSQILIVTGAMAIERVVKGRIHIAGFVALIFLYSLPFAWGFENFEFGLGCALWGFAFALLFEERLWFFRLVMQTAIIAVLFTAHMFALGVYGFAAGVHELWRGWSRRASLPEMASRLAVLAIPSLVFVAVMARTGATVGGAGTWWVFGHKHIWLLHILSGYNMPASDVGVVALVLLAVALIRRGAMKFEQSGAWMLAGFTVLYLAMPFEMFDTAFVDVRVVSAAALIMPAFVSVSFPSRAWTRASLAVAAALTVFNVGILTGVWMSYRSDYDDAMTSFQLLPKRAIVLVGDSGDGSDPPPNLIDYPIYNVPTLAVHYADAFVMDLFTHPGKQPVSPRESWRRLAVYDGSRAPVLSLKYIAEHGATPETPLFLKTWQRDFEYLYLIGPPIPNPMPDRIEQILTSRRFALYKIKKP